jgi:hypothetical protein
MSAAARAKALVFSWISRFGVPKTITSDSETQFFYFKYLVQAL